MENTHSSRCTYTQTMPPKVQQYVQRRSRCHEFFGEHIFAMPNAAAAADGEAEAVIICGSVGGMSVRRNFALDMAL